MIWIAYIAGGLVGLVLVMALIGLALPRDHVAARRTVLAKPPDEVWAALTDLGLQPGWRRGLSRIDQADAKRFTEHTGQGKIAYEVVEERPCELRITRIADDKLPFGGRWIYELAPEGAGTRLTITEDGFIKNPLFRFLAKTVFSMGATIEQLMTDLGKHLGAPSAIEPAEPSPLVTRRDKMAST
jgi:Polyketide cyclase / dehydrase and lipid transport